jgi:hypothetical protein
MTRKFKYQNTRISDVTIPLLSDHKNRTAICKNFYGEQEFYYEQNTPIFDTQPYGVDYPVLNTKLVYGYNKELSRYVYYKPDKTPLYLLNYSGINRCISDTFYKDSVTILPNLNDEIDVFGDPGTSPFGHYSHWFDEESGSGLNLVGETGIISCATDKRYLFKAEIIQQENYPKEDIHVSGKLIKNGNSIKRLRLRITSPPAITYQERLFPILTAHRLYFYIGRLAPFDSSRFDSIHQYYKLDLNKIHFYTVFGVNWGLIDPLNVNAFSLPQDTDIFKNYSDINIYRNTLTIKEDGTTNFNVIAKKLTIKSMDLPKNDTRSKYCLSDLFWVD